MNADYFFDTYAIIKMVEGKENYRKYHGEPIITSLYNIYEFSYYLLRQYDRNKAEEVLNKLNYNLIETREEDLMAAANIKFENKEQQLSYVDCMGYTLAGKNNLKFLTGDQKFEDKEEVEYVK
ncbi:MAG: hypothetical protein BRC29_02265 [Nanohaloarchaea archaeon SW_7_43_1]|nr:MAG: hypothetical protein BRC29_02265 [Nanohaloarchaea archaeon SW_7_43_1]